MFVRWCMWFIYSLLFASIDVYCVLLLFATILVVICLDWIVFVNGAVFDVLFVLFTRVFQISKHIYLGRLFLPFLLYSPITCRIILICPFPGLYCMTGMNDQNGEGVCIVTIHWGWLIRFQTLLLCCNRYSCHEGFWDFCFLFHCFCYYRSLDFRIYCWS